MSPTVHLTAVTALLLAGSAFAGDGAGKSAKTTLDPAPYEAGRGLLTLEGPTGMFINPTSATLPRGAFTAQYCIFFPNNRTTTIGNGALLSYGVTDWLEIGANGNYIAANRGKVNEREFGLGGPLVRIRLLKDESWWPQLSIGAYGKYGTNALSQTTTFLAAYKRIPLDEGGFIKSVGFHAGVRESWFHEDAAESNSVDGYGGLEVQFPARLYAIGEISTRGKTQGGTKDRVPFAYGIQWRLKGVNLSAAMIQNGSTVRPSFFSGVSFGYHF